MTSCCRASTAVISLMVLQAITTGSGGEITKVNYRFTGMDGDTVMTSSGNLTSHGQVVLLTSSHSSGVLDLQGPSYASFPSNACLQNIDVCRTGFTISVTFRHFVTLNATSNRLYVLDRKAITSQNSTYRRNPMGSIQIRHNTSTRNESTKKISTVPNKSLGQKPARQSVTPQIPTSQHPTPQNPTTQKSIHQHSTSQNSNPLHSSSQMPNPRNSTSQNSTQRNSISQHSTPPNATSPHSTSDNWVGDQVPGLRLYAEGADRLTCVLRGGTELWRVEVGYPLAPGVWHQLHASWHPLLGLTLWAGLHELGRSLRPLRAGLRSLYYHSRSRSFRSLSRSRSFAHRLRSLSKNPKSRPLHSQPMSRPFGPEARSLDTMRGQVQSLSSVLRLQPMSKSLHHQRRSRSLGAVLGHVQSLSLSQLRPLQQSRATAAEHPSQDPSTRLHLQPRSAKAGSRGDSFRTRAQRSAREISGDIVLFGSPDNADVIHLQLSGLSMASSYVTDIITEGLAGFYTTHQSTFSPHNATTTSTSTQLPPATTTSPTITTITSIPPPTTSPPPATSTPRTTTSTTPTETSEAASSSTTFESVRPIVVSFLMASGQQLLSTLGTMATQGDVSVQGAPPGGLAAVLDEEGESVELGYPLPCLRDVTSCRHGFTVRLTFELLKVSIGHNILLSSGGDQLDSVGVTLSYFNSELVFIVKTSHLTWMGLHAVQLQTGYWYTLDASWNAAQKNGTLHVSNQPALCRTFSLPHPPLPTQGIHHPFLLATGPGSPGPGGGGTTLMKVFRVTFWPVHRSRINDEDLDLPVLANEPLDILMTQFQSTVPTESGGDEAGNASRGPVTSERLGDDNASSGGDDDQVAVIVLGSLSAVLLAVTLCGAVVCLRSRRQRKEAWRELEQRHLSALSVDHSFRARPRPRHGSTPTAYHDRSFSTVAREMMY